jgi:hypothetical protein
MSIYFVLIRNILPQSLGRSIALCASLD